MTDTQILKQIGSKLKEIRIEANIKQREISQKSGISQFTISQMETGHNISILTLIQILKAMDRMDMLDEFLKVSEGDRKRVKR